MKKSEKETDGSGEIPQMANICKYWDSFETGSEVKKAYSILGYNQCYCGNYPALHSVCYELSTYQIFVLHQDASIKSLTNLFGVERRERRKQ